MWDKNPKFNLTNWILDVGHEDELSPSLWQLYIHERARVLQGISWRSLKPYICFFILVLSVGNDYEDNLDE